MVEKHPLPGDAVKVRGVVDAGAVTGDGLGRVVVCHDEDDVGLFWRHYVVISTFSKRRLSKQLAMANGDIPGQQINDWNGS